MYSRISLCQACGTRNRIPAAHLAETGKCGACKEALPPVSEPIELAEADFDEFIHGVRVPVLVDFWAGWCGPCRLVAPEVRQLARELAGRALVLHVNVDAAPGLTSRYQIKSIPYFMVFRDGSPVLHKPGTAHRAQMREWLESAASVS